MHEDGHDVPFVRIVAESTFASNALTNIVGSTPYQSVLGRTPPMLPSPNIDALDTGAGMPETSAAVQRVRE
eukprot:3578622-Amphidinium_carterae.1